MEGVVNSWSLQINLRVFLWGRLLTRSLINYRRLIKVWNCFKLIFWLNSAESSLFCTFYSLLMEKVSYYLRLFYLWFIVCFFYYLVDPFFCFLLYTLHFFLYLLFFQLNFLYCKFFLQIINWDKSSIRTGGQFEFTIDRSRGLLRRFLNVKKGGPLFLNYFFMVQKFFSKRFLCFLNQQSLRRLRLLLVHRSCSRSILHLYLNWVTTLVLRLGLRISTFHFLFFNF